MFSQLKKILLLKWLGLRLFEWISILIILKWVSEF